MNVVTILKMDLAQPERTQQVFCVQGDSFSRTVVMELLADGKVWKVPEGTSALISYYKPDGTCGSYTQLPDGTQAWEIDQNMVTVALTPQMLTAEGLVSAQLKLVCGEETLSTFAFQVVVRPGFAPGDDPETYTAWLTTYLPQTTDADLGQYLQVSQVDASGRVTGLTGREINLPPDHTNRILALEDRTIHLENSIGSVSQLNNRVNALERSTGEIPNLKNRIETLEYHADKYTQLDGRVQELENDVGEISQLGSRVQELETSVEAVPGLEGRVKTLEDTANLSVELESRVQVLEENMEDLAQLDARITALESGAPSYPAEWDSELEDCVETVRQHQAYGGKASVSFAYFSDNHNNGGCTGALIAHVMDACMMPFSFFCGDMVSQEILDDMKSVEKQIHNFNNMMSPVPNEKDLRALGEHDFCRTDSNGKLWGMEANQLYEYFFRKQYCRNQCVPGDDISYFYVDDNIHKFRFIVMNSQYFTPNYNQDLSLSNRDDYGFGQDQIDWLINNALYFEEDGWSVVFIAHRPLSNQGNCNLRDAHIVQGILSAFLERGTYHDYTYGRDSVSVDVDFQDAITAEIIGWFSGHTHNDSITTLELANDPESYSLPLNVVTISADGDNSHAIDFVTIDKELRTVFLTRLGHGENRSFTY